MRAKARRFQFAVKPPLDCLVSQPSMSTGGRGADPSPPPPPPIAVLANRSSACATARADAWKEREAPWTATPQLPPLACREW